ncbi:hypothetical protein MNBD_CHLOROFLEXI01-1508, partial [hydrothermal vent metagenome]
MMSDSLDFPQADDDELRCPNCDAVVTAVATLCLMCGAKLEPTVSAIEPETKPKFEAEHTPQTAASTGSVQAVSLLDASDDLPILKRVAPAAEAAVLQPAPEIVESVMKERQTPWVLWLTAVFFIVILLLGNLI